MAEIVEYRIEKTVEDLNLLVDFGLFSKSNARDILKKRKDFEYILQRRTKTKLDYLKYIKFEVNLLEAIEKYKNSVIKKHYQQKGSDEADELERRILLLQAKKLNDIIRSSSAHITSLFRKLTANFPFDKKLWLAYIDFAKSRRWNSRVTSLYWTLLRRCSDNHEIWIAAASHEIETNKAYDTARGLYLRALRHHPKVCQVWIEYFKMELKFMQLVDQRCRIIFRVTNKAEEPKEVWAEKDDKDEEQQSGDESFETSRDAIEDPVPIIKPIDEDDKIMSGHLLKVIYNNASKSLESASFQIFLINILIALRDETNDCKGSQNLLEFICSDVTQRFDDKDPAISEELKESLDCVESLKKLLENRESANSVKRLKTNPISKMNILYDCYAKGDAKGLEDARNKFAELEKSAKNRTLSLYVGMIQIESWQLAKDKSNEQMSRIKALYEKALNKFGQEKPKLWYEYLQFEHDNAKSLDDYERINQLYRRAQTTLEASKVDKVIEKYTLLQVNSSSKDIEYSDYSDLDE